MMISFMNIGSLKESGIALFYDGIDMTGPEIIGLCSMSGYIPFELGCGYVACCT
jgi:hypothetical protein